MGRLEDLTPTRRPSRVQSLDDFRRSRDFEQSQRQATSGPGLQSIASPGGKHIVATPTMLKWVYIVGLIPPDVLCKEAFWTSTGWVVGRDNNHLIKAHPAAATAGHFKFFEIGMEWDEEAEELQPIPGWNGQPLAEDMMCLLIAGAVMPMPRFNLVAPAAVEELCEPCGEEAMPARTGPEVELAPPPAWMQDLQSTPSKRRSGGCLNEAARRAMGRN